MPGEANRTLKASPGVGYLCTGSASLGAGGRPSNKPAELPQKVLALSCIRDVRPRSEQITLSRLELILEHLGLDVAAALVKTIAKIGDLLANGVEALNRIDQIGAVLLEHRIGLGIDQLSSFVVDLFEDFAEPVEFVPCSRIDCLASCNSSSSFCIRSKRSLYSLFGI